VGDPFLLIRYPLLSGIALLGLAVYLVIRTDAVKFAIIRCPNWKTLRGQVRFQRVLQALLSLAIVSDVLHWWIDPSLTQLLGYAVASYFLILLLNPSEFLTLRIVELRAAHASPAVERR
jgi:hypothetical protein